MSKVEIDTSEVSLEEQIAAARKYYWEVHNNDPEEDRAEMMRALCSGKFAKIPLPEIKKPKWAHYVWVNRGLSNYYVEANTAPRGTPAPHNRAYMCGPNAATEREAILAFNELFGAP